MNNDFIIISNSDCVDGYNHPTVPTAINNYMAYQEYWKDFTYLDNFKKDLQLDHLPTLEDVVEEYLNNKEKNTNSIPCKILASQVFSSERSIFSEKLGEIGYDRPLDQTKKEQLHLAHLRGSTGDKGFSSLDCMVLAGFIRIIYNQAKEIYEVTLTKSEGNGRIVKALITTKGEDLYLPFNIWFHKEGMSDLDMHKVEADMHNTDAEERNSQNEPQKFASALGAKIPRAVYAYNYLSQPKIELDFDDVMNSRREAQGKDKWKSLSSIGGIFRGQNEGMFSEKGKHPGEHYTTLAMISAKAKSEYTKERVIPISGVETIATLYHSFCQQVSNKKKPLFTENQLSDFLEMYAEHYAEEIEGKFELFSNKADCFTLKDLSISTANKSIEVIAVRVFWRDRAIVNFWKEKVSGSDNNGFSVAHPNVEHLLNKCSDRLLKKEMISTISGN